MLVAYALEIHIADLPNLRTTAALMLDFAILQPQFALKPSWHSLSTMLVQIAIPRISTYFLAIP